MKPMNKETQEEERIRLIEALNNEANSLKNKWIDNKAVYNWMLIMLTSAGYLKKKKEFYVKEDG